MYHLTFYSPVPILELLTFSRLSHGGIIYWNNMRRLGSKRRLQHQPHLLVRMVDQRDTKAFPLLLPCMATSTGVQPSIRVNIQVLHDAGYGG
jgi:hypothetical protein